MKLKGRRVRGLSPLGKVLAVVVLLIVFAVAHTTATAIQVWQDRQEVAAAHHAPQLSAGEVLAANALNERAMREDRLPDALSSPR
jgi:hypothetical protein